MVKVNPHCPDGLISFRWVTFSVPKYAIDKCLTNKCDNKVADIRCDCCKKPSDLSHVCHDNSSLNAEWKTYCESRQEYSSIPIGIVDLSGHCATQIN